MQCLALLSFLAIIAMTTAMSYNITVKICDKPEYCDCNPPNKADAGSLSASLKAQEAGDDCKCLCGKSVQKQEECTSPTSDDCELNSVCKVSGSVKPTCHWRTMSCPQFFEMARKANKDPYCRPIKFNCNVELKHGIQPMEAIREGQTHTFESQCMMSLTNYNLWNKDETAEMWSPKRF